MSNYVDGMEFNNKYATFQVASSSQEILLRETFQSAITPFNIKCTDQLRYHLINNRNELMLTPTHTLRCLQDGVTLVTADLIMKIETSVCWWKGCFMSSGKNSHLLCDKHGMAYSQLIDTIKEESRDIKLCDLGKDEMATTNHKSVTIKSEKFRADNIFRSIVTDCVILALHLLGNDTTSINPFTDIHDDLRDQLSSYLCGKWLRYRKGIFTYDSASSCFLYRNDFSERWMNVCNDIGCPSPAVENGVKCFTHLTIGDEWQKMIKTLITKACHVDKFYEITPAIRKSFIEHIKSNNNRINVVPDYIYIYISKRNERIFIRKKCIIYTICENYSADCGAIYYHLNGYDLCPKCKYGKVYTTMMLKFPNLRGGNVYWTTSISHMDTRMTFNSFNLNKIVKERLAKVKLEGNLRHEQYVVIRKDENLPSEEEAASQCGAYFILTMLLGHLFATKIEFINKTNRIGKGLWRNVNRLAAEYGFYVGETNETLVLEEPFSFRMKQKSSQNEDIDSQNFVSTVYLIRVQELEYVGDKTVVDPKGRKSREIGMESHEKKAIKMRLMSLGVDVENDYHVPYIVLAEKAVVDVGPLYQESICILARTVHEQILNTFNIDLLNLKLDSTVFEDSWFHDLQFVTKYLSGSTIKIFQTKRLQLENTFLFTK